MALAENLESSLIGPTAVYVTIVCRFLSHTGVFPEQHKKNTLCDSKACIVLQIDRSKYDGAVVTCLEFLVSRNPCGMAGFGYLLM